MIIKRKKKKGKLSGLHVHYALNHWKKKEKKKDSKQNTQQTHVFHILS